MNLNTVRIYFLLIPERGMEKKGLTRHTAVLAVYNTSFPYTVARYLMENSYCMQSERDFQLLYVPVPPNSTISYSLPSW